MLPGTLMEQFPTKQERFLRELMKLSAVQSINGYFVVRFSPADSCAGCSDVGDNITTLNVPAITAYFMVTIS